jgi:hypothetical protein
MNKQNGIRQDCMKAEVSPVTDTAGTPSAGTGLMRHGLRFLTVVALAVWFGGFTFYSTAVIATSQKVLHSQLRAGLITQQVTNWLNWISLPALAICALNWFIRRKNERRFWVWVLGASLAGMVLFQVALFPTHWVLDGRIVDREIANEAAFFRWHRVYLALATAQWCATLGYIWATLVLWSEVDHRKNGER